MNIVMVSDYETQGGAAVDASRLAEGLCQAGHRVTRLVGVPDGQEHSWNSIRLTATKALPLLYRMIRRLLPSRGRTVWDEQMVQSRFNETLGTLLTALCPDVISVHNLHGATRAGWSPNLLRICASYAPTVWTLHDVWSFTGRCAYSYDCCKFITGCDSTCPTAHEHPALAPDRIAGAWEQRKQLLGKVSSLVAVSPSHWLAAEARRGLWSGHKVTTIPYGLPLDTYHAVDRTLARKALGIRENGQVLLTASFNLDERRKGAGILVEALQCLAQRPLTLVTMGSGRLDFAIEGVHLHSLGYIDHERTKVLAYNAADVLVHTALADNLPNVIMESLACGTPVVGFDVGGVSELVRPGQTGWLAEEISSRALAKALEKALENLRYSSNLRNTSRSLAEAEFDMDLQAQRYNMLFESLMEHSHEKGLK